eukprot:CAMPEP_0204916436 /NCGR_PEP_ID=MMETSP1397-20131031/14241_1 /ASSEMBLY_ACC=CAM_ASM_000891 /TAXON_ID=49980 /ORGANISM="Climacostomum Climacostomum virens, Strain Stock W-24" /LENGTH=183 /DNA_ID=CAMNT_0052088925 /DNA_START=10 /DNA_END=557 /DNA_ORIENTATION=-
MDTDRSKSSAYVAVRGSAPSRYSKRERRKPEVFDPAQEEMRSVQPDLKVKFKVVQSKGLKPSLGSKQFMAESVWQTSYFVRKLVRELGLSTKYQYTILVLDSEKGWVKLSSLSQLTPNCKLRVYKVQQRAASPKAEAPVPQASQSQMMQSNLYHQSMMYAYNVFQLQQMMLAYQQYGMPYFGG